MAESFYTSGTPTSIPPQIPSSPTSPSGPPPPPPPKPLSHAPTQTGIPSNQPSSPTTYQAPQHFPQTSPPPPPVPPSPSHAQALAKQQQNARNTATSPEYQGHSQGHGQGYSESMNQPHFTQQLQSQWQHNTIPPPPLDSEWLPDGLSNKSTAELQPLLNNPDLLTAFAHRHPAYGSSVEPLRAAVSANLTLAQQVAALEAQVKQLRDQTGQLLINHTSLQTQWRRKQTEMDDALSPWGPRSMYQRLVSSIAEQEALLRAVHESFIEGGEDGGGYYDGASNKATEKEVTEWVRRIREGTTVLEKRREMRARWDEGRVGGWR